MDPLPAALARPIAPGSRVVEVGVGGRSAVAEALAAAGHGVVATDRREVSTPNSVAFHRDDVTDPDRSIYEGAALVYALRCPPEMQRPLAEVARSAGARAAFTTLGGDPATVPVDRETLAAGTLFWVDEERPLR
jgi:uncharacterized UPF0146 family protein